MRLTTDIKFKDSQLRTINETSSAKEHTPLTHSALNLHYKSMSKSSKRKWMAQKDQMMREVRMRLTSSNPRLKMRS